MRLIGLAIVAAVVLAFAPGAGASPFPSVVCNDVLPAGVYFHIEVGATPCVAERGILVTGGVYAGAGFTLGQENRAGLTGIIGGGVNRSLVAGTGPLQLHHARITGGIDAFGASHVNAITNNDITGNVKADHLSAGCLPQTPTRPSSFRLVNNMIDGNVRIVRGSKNGCHPMDFIVVSGNTITGNLDCGRTPFERNDPPVTLGGGPPNIVFGMKVGDCVGL